MGVLAFWKMEGAGNDFILVDDRAGRIRDPKAAARRLCDRKFSVGADGLILLCRSRKADARMRILNPDGSEAEMCGNGVRCLAKFAVSRGLAGRRMTVETLAGVIHCRVTGGVVTARLSEPRDLRLKFTIPVGGRKVELHSVNTGVPHAVRVVDSLEDVDVDSLGRSIRFHPRFAPKGTNVNFIEFGAGNAIRVATYERGVECETLACGTGSTASALVAAALKGLKSPVHVRTAGGETLRVHFERSGGRFRHVELEGRVKKTFEGRVNL
jgi:diaminopimelate epimerase